MKIQNEIEVAAPPEELFGVLSDVESHRAVMEASAQETNGQGNAQARITASVSGSDSRSVLNLDTDLEVRGKAAQFGRGVLGNVSQRILDQFARNLESEVLSSREEPPPEEDAPTVEAEGAEPGGARPQRAAPVG